MGLVRAAYSSDLLALTDLVPLMPSHLPMTKFARRWPLALNSNPNLQSRTVLVNIPYFPGYPRTFPSTPTVFQQRQ